MVEMVKVGTVGSGVTAYEGRQTLRVDADGKIAVLSEMRVGDHYSVVKQGTDTGWVSQGSLRPDVSADQLVAGLATQGWVTVAEGK